MLMRRGDFVRMVMIICMRIGDKILTLIDLVGAFVAIAVFDQSVENQNDQKNACARAANEDRGVERSNLLWYAR